LQIKLASTSLTRQGLQPELLLALCCRCARGPRRYSCCRGNAALSDCFNGLCQNLRAHQRGLPGRFLALTRARLERILGAFHSRATCASQWPCRGTCPRAGGCCRMLPSSLKPFGCWLASGLDLH